MAKESLLKKLQKLEGAVIRDTNPFNSIVRSSNPSVNFVFGNTHGMPQGYCVLFYGPSKGGKSLVVNDFIGQLHKDDPEAYAVKYDTEMREKVQMTDRMMKMYGIDPSRYIAYSVNNPVKIFDAISTEIRALCQEGYPIKLIAIDSVKAIMGRREATNNKGVMGADPGDEAQTIQKGLKQILEVVREHNIALLLTTHVRAEMDPQKAKYFPTKMAAAWALKHFAECFVSVEPYNAAEGKKDIYGKDFIDNTLTDFKNQGELLAHKIRVCMKDSSIGPKGRVGEITFHKYQGFINQEEQIFHLATRRKVVEHSGKSYIVHDFPVAGETQKYVGKGDFASAIKQNDDLAQELIRRVRAQDVEAMTTGVWNGGAVNMAENEDENAADTDIENVMADSEDIED